MNPSEQGAAGMRAPGTRRPRGGQAHGRARCPSASASKRREAALFARYQFEGDLAARTELIERFLPLARTLARRYARPSEPFDDLVQVASVGLVKAIDRFEPGRGTGFAGYAIPTILGELRRYFRDAGWSLHVPRGMQERVLAVEKTIERLSADRGSAPSPHQIAAAMGLSIEQVLEAMVAHRGHDTMSLDAPAHHPDEDGATVVDVIGSIDEGFELAEYRPAVALALEHLPVRERSIIYMRFAEDLTQLEIGRRLGLSQMQVSRLIRAALERMRVVAGEA